MSIEYSVTFGVPRHIIYKAFLDEFDLSKMARSKVTIKPEVGGEFNIYDGKIVGKITELVG